MWALSLLLQPLSMLPPLCHRGLLTFKSRQKCDINENILYSGGINADGDQTQLPLVKSFEKILQTRARYQRLAMVLKHNKRTAYYVCMWQNATTTAVYRRKGLFALLVLDQKLLTDPIFYSILSVTWIILQYVSCPQNVSVVHTGLCTSHICLITTHNDRWTSLEEDCFLCFPCVLHISADFFVWLYFLG